MIFNIQLPVDIKNKKCFARAKHFLFFGSIFSLFVRFLLCVSCSSSIAYNVLPLCVVADFEPDTFELSLIFILSLNFKLIHLPRNYAKWLLYNVIFLISFLANLFLAKCSNLNHKNFHR